MKKYQSFLSENFPFLVVKLSIYLNRRVFIMGDFDKCHLKVVKWHPLFTIEKLI